VTTARAGHLPTLYFNGSYGKNASWGDSTFTSSNPPFSSTFPTGNEGRGPSFGVTLSVPIFAGGATQSRVRQALAQRDVASDELEQQKRGLERATRNAYQTLVAGISEVEARRLALVSAQSAYDASQVGLEVGTRTVLDVLNNQQTLFRAQLDYAQAVRFGARGLPQGRWLAAAQALDRFAAEPIRLKWPNDLFIDRGKLAGILVEARWREQALEWVSIGLGVNVKAPENVENAAGLEPGVERLDVLSELLPALRTAAQKTGPLRADEREVFNARDLARGKTCIEPAVGRVAGISPTGELLVALADSVVPFRSGSLVLQEDR